MLYWFRSPPGVKVGRAALDEIAIRLIEDTHPDIEFDWTRILKGEGSGERPERPERQDRGDRGGRPERGGERASRRQGREGREGRDREAREVRDYRGGSQSGRGISPDRAPGPPPPAPEPAALGLEAAPPLQPPVEAPGVPTGVDAPGHAEEDSRGAPAVVPSGPAVDRLGVEALERLRGRYAEILARIAERGLDAEQDEAMRAEAEGLNPDAWVTDDEVTRGLDQYEAVLERLRSVVGLRRRRRRRGGRSGDAGTGSGPAESGSTSSNPVVPADAPEPAPDEPAD